MAKQTPYESGQLVLGWDDEPIKLKPLHLLYLTAIMNGDFDKNIHRGYYHLHEHTFTERVQELMTYGLVSYKVSITSPNWASTIWQRSSINLFGNCHE